MATYVLGAIGTAIGGPIGGAVGALVGGLVDRAAMSALTPSSSTSTVTVGPRLLELSVTNSSEGSMLPRVVGRARIGGQVIWATQFKETPNVTETQQQAPSSGGKGGGGGGTQTTWTVNYLYSMSFAIAFCEGNRHTQLGRVWIDGTETDLSKYNFRWYSGSESQSPDSLIQAIEGATVTPAYRGVAYLVFEDMPLADFGNRMPQVTAEVIVPLDTTDPDDLSNLGRAFQMIPSTGEVAYGTVPYWDTSGGGASTQNLHNNFRRPDAEVAFDQLNTFQTSLEAVSLVVAWFGDDLRADQCTIVPKVEDHTRSLKPADWAVESYVRGTAQLVSRDSQNRPVFGGTPSDDTVVQFIQYMKNAGKRVSFYPFILMDIPGTNTLPDPYSNGASTTGQPAFPWRGRITCSPAAGYTGSPDKTSSAATQVNTFFTRTEGYRRMVLHYANLVVTAGGVDSFIIGSELVGLTTVRSTPGDGTYPAVNALVTLLADVRAIFSAAGMSSIKVGYAADWTEYHSHRPVDGTNDVIFNMDPLWAVCDFVGIDDYMPLADWRDGTTHLDYNSTTGPVSTYDRSYLKGSVEGGELYDWYYASGGDRDTQTRTTINDTAYGEHWVFRQKDIRNWWSSVHRSRPGGVRNASATSWTAQSKPVWLTEFGCPAVDKGPNQPNVFVDPKSSESHFPYYSNGLRDDLAQRMYLECKLQYWRDNSPTSTVYGDKMLSISNMFVWTWDARPFPAYPAMTSVWSDGLNWELGHWLSGRIDSAVLARLVASICQRVGLSSSQYDVEGLYGPGALVRGMYIANDSTERDILDQLSQFYQFLVFESEGKLKFSLAVNSKTTVVPSDDLVLDNNATFPITVSRKQSVDLPDVVQITYLNELNGFQPASVTERKDVGNLANATQLSFPMVASASQVMSLALAMVQVAWQAREYGELALPPSYARVAQGDALQVPVAASRSLSVRVDQIDQGATYKVQFSGFDTTQFTPSVVAVDEPLPLPTYVFQSVELEFMDLPLTSSSEELPHAPRLAAHAVPWPGAVNILKSDGAGGFTLIQQVGVHAYAGVLASALYSGPTDRWDHGNVFNVTLETGSLSAMTQDQLLATTNGNALAIQNASSGLWEIVQFTSASLVSAGTYQLKGLLRGLLDTADAMASGPYASGSKVVVLTPGLLPGLNMSSDQVGLPILYSWGPSIYPTNDPTYVTGTYQGTKRGLRPFTPCDCRVQRDSGTGDLTITWKRCTRYGGDGWEQAEVPLNEEFEQYQLQVLTGPGGAVKRSAVVTSPTWTYLAADQTTDFGSHQTTVYLEIAQYGSYYGGYGGTLAGYFYMGSST